MGQEKFKKYYLAAREYIASGEVFEMKTDFATSKAGELLVASFVNALFRKNGSECEIELSTAPRGADGWLIGVPNLARNFCCVEIKTSKAGGSFQFSKKFLPKGFCIGGVLVNEDVCAFDQHIMVICAVLGGSGIESIYIVRGKEMMGKLAEMLAEDAARDSFNLGRGDNPQIYSRSGRNDRSSLDELCQDISKIEYQDLMEDNWAIKIDKADFIQEIERSLS